MAQQTINIGAAPDDGTGDTLRDGGDKINDNFTELYAFDAAAPELIRDTMGTALVAGANVTITPNDGADTITIAASSGGAVEILDEGVSETASVVSLDFTGSGVAAADDGFGNVTITIPGGISTFALGDATDVDTTGEAAGDGLTFNGTNWVPKKSALFEDQKAANTNGGASTSGSWITRTLNTEVFDDIGITLASNQLALAAGIYEVDASCFMYAMSRGRCRIRDVTNNVTLALSENVYSSGTNPTGQWPRCMGRFTLAGAASVELQYRVQTGVATNGLGVESNFGEIEIYSRVKLTKIA